MPSSGSTMKLIPRAERSLSATQLFADDSRLGKFALESTSTIARLGALSTSVTKSDVAFLDSHSSVARPPAASSMTRSRCRGATTAMSSRS